MRLALALEVPQTEEATPEGRTLRRVLRYLGEHRDHSVRSTLPDIHSLTGDYLHWEGHENRIYEITGSEVIGPREIEQIASEVTGRQFLEANRGELLE
jgi:hypothetical protein